MAPAVRVLVTNDDGLPAEGLRHLAAYARDQGLDVVVAAPESDASGCGTSRAVAADGVIRARTGRLPGLAGLPVHTVAGPPGLIVTAACQGVFGAAPDLVLAGINPGANVGLGVMHSGTVGAALTAARHGCPAVALSIELGGPYHWPTALAALSVVLPVVLGPAAPDRPPLVLNTNVPNIAVHELLGVVRTGLAPRSAAEFTVERVGPELLRAHHRDGPSGSEGDSGLLAAGYATVTPLGLVTEDADAAFALPLPDIPQPGLQTAVRHPLTAGGPQ